TVRSTIPSSRTSSSNTASSPSSAATAAFLSGLRPVTATSAPKLRSASAIARPSPPFPPVTRATRPASVKRSSATPRNRGIEPEGDPGRGGVSGALEEHRRQRAQGRRDGLVDALEAHRYEAELGDARAAPLVLLHDDHLLDPPRAQRERGHDADRAGPYDRAG